MARGKAAPEGSTYVSQNGYHYTKRNGRFTATHVLIAQDKLLGRPIQPHERIRFKDGDKTNLDPNNLEVTIKGTSSLKTQKARLEARIQEFQAQLDEVNRRLELGETKARLDELQSTEI
jgi:hypothetical protein